MLNPETSSDSPSAKSKGVRLVSAKQEINHIPTSGGKMNSFDQNRLSKASSDSLGDSERAIKNSIIRANLTSYETV